MFGKLKDLWQLKGQMDEIKKRLDAMVIKVESDKKLFEIILNGSQEIKEIKVTAPLGALDNKTIEEDLKKAVNKGLKDSQMMAAQAMGGLAGFKQPEA